MPRFAYNAFDVSGAEKTGLLDAPDAKEAAIILRGQGLFPTEVARVDVKPLRTPPLFMAIQSFVRAVTRQQLPFGRSVKLKELSIFTRQLATLLKAGMPLLRGLEVLVRQERNQSFKCILAVNQIPTPRFCRLRIRELYPV